MKRISAVLFLFAFTIFHLPLQAQFKEIAKSSPFDEPETGEGKIVLLKDGSTFFLTRSTDNELQYRLYDAKHKEIINTGLNIQKLTERASIKGPFEIKHNIVLFVIYRSKGVVDLKRITIDASTGKMTEEVLVFTVSSGGYSVNKDPESDSYVISKTEIKDKNEEEGSLILFDGNHKEISRAEYNGPANDASNYFRMGDMHIINGNVYAFGIQRPKKNGSYNIKGPKYMAILKKGMTKVEYTPLNIPENIVYTSIVTKYNKTSNKIFFMINDEDAQGTTREKVFINVIDAGTGKLSDIEVKTAEKISIAYKESFGKKKEFTGRPQDFFINDDGSFTIIYQELLIDESGKNLDIFLGKVLAANYDSKGNCTLAYIMSKNHVVHDMNATGFTSFRNTEEEFVMCNKGDQYKFIKYINGSTKKYLLLNDVELNNDVKNDKYVMVTGVSMCDGFFFKLEGNEFAPKREYVFGSNAPAHVLGNFSISDYNKATNVFVTLRFDKNAITDRLVNIVWLQPE